MKIKDLQQHVGHHGSLNEQNKAKLASSANKKFYEDGFDKEVMAFINRRRFKPGGCEDMSYRLAQSLDENGYRDRIKVVFGSYEGEVRPGYEGGRGTHIWVEVDGKIVDLTAGQFKDYPKMDISKYKAKRRV